MSSFVQVVIPQSELKLLGRVEKTSSGPVRTLSQLFKEISDANKYFYVECRKSNWTQNNGYCEPTVGNVFLIISKCFVPHKPRVTNITVELSSLNP